MRRAFLSAVFALLVAAPGHAAETLFTIIKTDGTAQPVTYEDVRKIGQKTIDTPVFGYQDQAKITREVTGPLMRDVLKHFSVEGAIAEGVALDAYRIDVPVEDALKYDVVMATAIDGKRLSVRDRGPVWIIYPLKDHPELINPMFEGRSIWQLKELRMK